MGLSLNDLWEQASKMAEASGAIPAAATTTAARKRRRPIDSLLLELGGAGGAIAAGIVPSHPSTVGVVTGAAVAAAMSLWRSR